MTRLEVKVKDFDQVWFLCCKKVTSKQKQNHALVVKSCYVCVEHVKSGRHGERLLFAAK